MGRKCELLLPSFQLPASTTPVFLVGDWDVLIDNWSSNPDKGKPSKCASLLKITETKSSIMVWSSSTLWLQFWRPSSAGAKRTTSNSRSPRWMSLKGTAQVGQDCFV